MKRLVTACSRKIIKRFVRDPDKMVPDKGSPFCCAGFRMFDGAFPFQYRPAFKIIRRQLAENAFKIHLPVAQAPETADPFMVVTGYFL